MGKKGQNSSGELHGKPRTQIDPANQQERLVAQHQVELFAQRQRFGGKLICALPAKPLSVAAFSLITRRRSFSGSVIGGIAETQEMLDFCGAHNITADVEVIPIQKVNEAYERLLKSNVKYRFSIDMASLKSE